MELEVEVGERTRRRSRHDVRWLVVPPPSRHGPDLGRTGHGSAHGYGPATGKVGAGSVIPTSIGDR